MESFTENLNILIYFYSPLNQSQVQVADDVFWANG